MTGVSFEVKYMSETSKKSIVSYKDLVVWQKALDLVEHIYRCTKKFPDSEKFGLVFQMRRAAASIPSNIAEGRSRNSRKDFTHFLYLSLGSAAELETQAEIARRLSYLEKVEYNAIMSLLEEISKMLRKMAASLKARS